MNIDRLCLKCGGDTYSDFDPMCEHDGVPQPTVVLRATGGGERHWHAAGFVWGADGLLTCHVAEHPLREEAIRRWRERWLLGWRFAEISAHEMLSALARAADDPVDFCETNEELCAKIDNEIALAVAGELAAADAVMSRQPIGTVIANHGPDPERPDCDRVTIQLFAPQAMFTEAERAQMAAHVREAQRRTHAADYGFSSSTATGVYENAEKDLVYALDGRRVDRDTWVVGVARLLRDVDHDEENAHNLVCMVREVFRRYAWANDRFLPEGQAALEWLRVRVGWSSGA